jgi:hypothetical protein
MPDTYTDLYEIVIRLETDGIRARREKYKTKRTAMNFLALRITDEEHEQGYSHRMSSRVPVGQLMRVQSLGFGDGSDHICRHGYCLPEQQAELLAALKAEITATVKRMRENILKLDALWQADDFKIMEKKHA